ncbi:MAG TPA: ABC transporter substrate-binding protein [Actinobacteria bacterium]|nr:ABC transporter substrate-binding protein [Actinomycetota bacterium]
MPIIPPERGDDLHNLELAGEADLTLFMAGNQFMVMEELLDAFREEHPDVERIFYETLPPGLELRQILAGGAVFGEQAIDVMPDIYAAVSADAMEQLAAAGVIGGGDAGASGGGTGYRVYLHNRLVLMVPAGNPAGVASVADLGRDDVRVSQPDPENEDIARHILNMCRQAGGEELVRRVMEEKVAAGTTLLTRVHHRETPERLAAGEADVGPVWATEVEHARRSGAAVAMVDPGPELDQRGSVDYYICALKGSARPENGSRFMEFIFSQRAREIYESYGFVTAG